MWFFSKQRVLHSIAWLFLFFQSFFWKNILNTHGNVLSLWYFQTPQSYFLKKMLRCVSYFQLSCRCLKTWQKAVCCLQYCTWKMLCILKQELLPFMIKLRFLSYWEWSYRKTKTKTTKKLFMLLVTWLVSGSHFSSRFLK